MRVGKVDPLMRQVEEVRRSLRILERSLVRLAESLNGVRHRRTRSLEQGERPRVRPSPARLRALRLHGRYLGYIRQLRPRARAAVKALRMKRGVRAAIAKARKLAAT